MTLRLGLSNDVDLAPLFFPWEAGWVLPPAGIVTENRPLFELEKGLLDGSLDVAPVSPLTYVSHQAQLRIIPTPVRAFDVAADSIFLISLKRLDQLERVRVAISPNSQTGEAILKIIAPAYYGIVPECFGTTSEAAALEALQGLSEICVLTGESAMRAVGWAKSKGYFVEDLTKAWWIMTGLPLPIYLFAVRTGWISQEPAATSLIRSLMLTFRRAIQHSQEQRPTLLEHTAHQTGLPAEALDNHFKAQRYELNEAHLRGLLEFYRRAKSAGLAPGLDDLNFFPTLSPLVASPATPPRRSLNEIEAQREASNSRAQAQAAEETGPAPRPTPSNFKKPKPISRRSEAQARGLRVIKGGKDKSNRGDKFESDEE